jgi:hypothetical protein
MSILGGYLRAREGAYFKVEQESDLQKHAQRLKAQGKLHEDDHDDSQGKDDMRDSEALYEVRFAGLY